MTSHVPKTQGDRSLARRSSTMLSTARSKISADPVDQRQARHQPQVRGVAGRAHGEPFEQALSEPAHCRCIAAVVLRKVHCAQHSRPGQQLIAAREFREVAVDEIDDSLCPRSESLVSAPAVGLGKHCASSGEALPIELATLGERSPCARKPRFGRGIVGHVGNAEPIADPPVAFGGGQGVAPVDERGAPALCDQRLGSLHDQPARERP